MTLRPFRNALLGGTVLVATAAACAIGFAPGVAQATTLNFAYNDGTDPVISGVLTGTLAADGNTFTVTGIDSLALNGSAVSMPVTYYGSLDTAGDLGEGPNGDGSGVVTIDGSLMDLAVLDASVGDGFFFGNGDLYTTMFGSPVVAGGSSFGGFIAGFNPADWQASVESVPEPVSLALLGFALPALAAARYRRCG